MYAHSLNTSCTVRHRRTIVTAVVLLLLWWTWSFAVHNHNDETTGSDTECQICQFGAHNSTALPAIGFSPIPFLPEAVSDTFTEITFIVPRIRVNHARAPPSLS